MKRHYLFTVLLGSAIVWACGNNNNDAGDTASDTSTTGSDTSTMTTGADTGATATPTVSSTPLEEKDKDFVMKAASGGVMEVELGNIAQQNAMSQRVKDFGAMMVRDHTKANDELKSLASAKGLTLNADSLMMKHKGHIESLRKKTGKDFDKAYMDMMLKDHKVDVGEFEKTSNSAKDADLKNFASKTLPVLHTHLDSAQAINKAKM